MSLRQTKSTEEKENTFSKFRPCVRSLGPSAFLPSLVDLQVIPRVVLVILVVVPPSGPPAHLRGQRVGAVLLQLGHLKDQVLNRGKTCDFQKGVNIGWRSSIYRTVLSQLQEELSTYMNSGSKFDRERKRATLQIWAMGKNMARNSFN